MIRRKKVANATTSASPTVPSTNGNSDSLQNETAPGTPQVPESNELRSLEHAEELAKGLLKNATNAKELRRSSSQDTLPDSDSVHSISSPTSVAPSEYENAYTGGYSQWREYENEDAWDMWDWPPYGWRPSAHHRSYWDSSSNYYRFNDYKWGWNNWSDPEKPGVSSVGDESTGTPIRTPSPVGLLSTPSSDDLNKFNDAMQTMRMNSGDLVHQSSGGDVEKVASDADAAKSSESPSPVVNNCEAKAAVSASASVSEKKDNAAEEISAKELGKTGKSNLTELDEEEVMSKRLKAHARYMRYYRSIRSVELSTGVFQKHFASLYR